MRNDDLDKALDNALARYASEEPRAGLEQRVLARVRADSAAPRFAWGRWALAIVLAATIMTAVLWKRPPLPHRAVARAMEGGLQPARGFSPALAQRSSSRMPAKQSSQARKPVPLTREERAWLTLAARAPDQTREALLDLERRGTELIQVEEIKIEPLRSHDETDDARDDAK